MSKKLHSQGIQHVVVTHAEVASVSFLPLRALSFEPEELLFQPRQGATRRVAVTDLILLVLAEITRESHEEGRTGSGAGKTRQLSPGYKLHLFGASSGAFELDPESFDWGVLGGAKSTSTVLNLRRLIQEILDRASGACLDEGFSREPPVVSPAETPGTIEVLLSPDSPRPRGVVFDNTQQFRFYSRWRFQVALRARRAGAE
jgi:hypothetical protein